MKSFSRAIGFILAASLQGCGSETPTAPQPPIPNMAGTWNMQWLVQFHRTRDAFEGQFYCYGSLTLSQSASSGPSASLDGFTVVSGCPLGTFDVTGTVRPDGTVDLVTVGPRPSEGQCPFVPQAHYSGQVASNVLSARAVENVTCPGPGEGPHRFDYILTAYKNVT